jgi:hypothetical protein
MTTNTVEKKINTFRSTNIPLNLIASITFVVFNPVFALPILAFFSFFVKKFNNIWAGTLYSISFAFLFSQWDYRSVQGPDVGNYVRIYQNIDGMSYSFLFERYINNLLHNEFLWFAYTKFISNLTDNNSTYFVFITYLFIFGLSAHLFFLVSKSHSINYFIILFCAIWLNMAFQISAFHLWRHAIAALIFLICVIHISSGYSNIFARLGLFLSPLFHTAVLPLVLLFVVYELFVKKKNNKIIFNNYFVIRASTMFVIGIIVLEHFNYIFNQVFEISAIKSGYTEFKHINTDIDSRFLITPIIILFFFYVIAVGKNILYTESYVFLGFILICIIPALVDIFPQIFMGRIRTVFMFIIPVIAAKLVIRTNHYGLFALCCIVLYRLYTFLNPHTIHVLSYVGDGNYLNPFYGLFLMIYNL